MTDLKIYFRDGKMFVIETNNHLILFSYESKIIELKSNLSTGKYELEYFNDSSYVQTMTTFKHVINFLNKVGIRGYNYKKIKEIWETGKRVFD